LNQSPSGKPGAVHKSKNRMPEIIQGIAFVDGIKQLQPAA
jgi:hypothetical protein